MEEPLIVAYFVNQIVFAAVKGDDVSAFRNWKLKETSYFVQQSKIARCYDILYQAVVPINSRAIILVQKFRLVSWSNAKLPLMCRGRPVGLVSSS